MTDTLRLGDRVRITRPAAGYLWSRNREGVLDAVDPSRGFSYRVRVGGSAGTVYAREVEPVGRDHVHLAAHTPASAAMKQAEEAPLLLDVARMQAAAFAHGLIPNGRIESVIVIAEWVLRGGLASEEEPEASSEELKVGARIEAEEADELLARLPVGARVRDQEHDIWTKTEAGYDLFGAAASGTPAEYAPLLIEDLPAPSPRRRPDALTLTDADGDVLWTGLNDGEDDGVLLRDIPSDAVGSISTTSAAGVWLTRTDLDKLISQLQAMRDYVA